MKNHNLHFAELAWALKQEEFSFEKVMDWYVTHYVGEVAREHPHYYVGVMAMLIAEYLEDLGLIRVRDILRYIRHSNLMAQRFKDHQVWWYATYESELNYRILVECCGILRLTKVVEIPGLEELRQKKEQHKTEG